MYFTGSPALGPDSQGIEADKPRSLAAAAPHWSLHVKKSCKVSRWSLLCEEKGFCIYAGHHRTQPRGAVGPWYLLGSGLRRTDLIDDSGLAERGLVGCSIHLTDGFNQFKCEALASFLSKRHESGGDVRSHL